LDLEKQQRKKRDNGGWLSRALFGKHVTMGGGKLLLQQNKDETENLSGRTHVTEGRYKGQDHGLRHIKASDKKKKIPGRLQKTLACLETIKKSRGGAAKEPEYYVNPGSSTATQEKQVTTLELHTKNSKNNDVKKSELTSTKTKIPGKGGPRCAATGMTTTSEKGALPSGDAEMGNRELRGNKESRACRASATHEG